MSAETIRAQRVQVLDMPGPLDTETPGNSTAKRVHVQPVRAIRTRRKSLKLRGFYRAQRVHPYGVGVAGALDTPRAHPTASVQFAPPPKRMHAEAMEGVVNVSVEADDTALELRPMLEQEADLFGGEQSGRRAYVRVDSGKAYLSPLGEAATWFQLADVHPGSVVTTN